MALTPERRRQLLAHPEPGAVLDVVIDADATNEVDDEFTIAWALLHPERLNVLALHACPYGQDPALFARPGLLAELDRRRWLRGLAKEGRTVEDVPVRLPADGVVRSRDEMAKVAALCGADVPVLLGADRYLPDAQTPVDSPAARDLVRLAHLDREGPLYVAAMGCATNVASALLLDPSIAEKIVVLWTSAYPSFWPRPNASFNLAQDVPAAQVLLTSGVPLVYLPGYYVGEELRTTAAEIEAYVAGVGPLGEYLAGLYATHGMVPQGRGQSKVLWDLVCVAWLLQPDWLADDLVPTPVLDADLVWRAQPDAPVMREAFDLDRDAIFSDLFAVLADLAGRG